MSKGAPYPFKRLKQALGNYYGLSPEEFSHTLLMFVHHKSIGYSDEDRKPFIDLLGAVLSVNMITKGDVVRLMQSIEKGMLAMKWIEAVKKAGGSPKMPGSQMDDVSLNIGVRLGGIAGMSPAPQRMIDVLDQTMDVEPKISSPSIKSLRKNSAYQGFKDNINSSRNNILSSTLIKPVGHKPSFIARIRNVKPVKSNHSRRHPPGILDPDKLAAFALEMDLYQRMNKARWDGLLRRGYRG